MDDGSRLPWVFALFLLACAFFCAVAETSFSAASRPKMKALAEDGNSRAQVALEIMDKFDQAITSLLIGTNICHLGIASIVTVRVTRIWGLSAVTLSTIATTMVVFYLGEMLPKSIAKKCPEKMAVQCAGILKTMMAVLSPVASALTWIGNRAVPDKPNDAELSVTEDELYDIIEDMTEEGSLNEEQGDLISSALQFGDLTVESVLTPRVDMVAIDVKSTQEETLAIIRANNHSRLPVYEGTVDHVIGILPIREFIKAYLHKRDTLELRSLLDQPLFVHQSSYVKDALTEMTKKRQTIAIVTDNYGGTLGIVTIEDILEELVGEIWDEEDVVEEPVTKLADGSYSADADEHVSDVMEQIGYEDPEDNEELANTVLGAWALETFKTIPQPGDSFDYHNLHVTVQTMDHNRILRLRLQIFPTDKEGGDKA